MLRRGRSSSGVACNHDVTNSLRVLGFDRLLGRCNGVSLPSLLITACNTITLFRVGCLTDDRAFDIGDLKNHFDFCLTHSELGISQCSCLCIIGYKRTSAQHKSSLFPSG